MLNAHVFALAKAGDFEAAIVAAGSARRYSPDADTWRAIGVAAGRQGAADAVRSRYPASQGQWRNAMFLLGLAEGVLERGIGGCSLRKMPDELVRSNIRVGEARSVGS